MSSNVVHQVLTSRREKTTSCDDEQAVRHPHLSRSQNSRTESLASPIFRTMPHSFHVQRVLNPTEARLAEAANLFTDLMKNNLGALSLSGGEVSLMNFQALALLRAGSLFGEYYEATDDEGRLLGFTMWMPPGQEMFSTEEQRRLGFNDFMKMLSNEAENYFKTKYIAQFPGFVASLIGPRGKIDSWWLHMAMVRRDYQKQGVLRALIDLVRKKAEDAGEYLATCTTNDDNIRVYTGLGFAYKGSTEMDSPWGKWPIHLFKMDLGNPEDVDDVAEHWQRLIRRR